MGDLEPWSHLLSTNLGLFRLVYEMRSVQQDIRTITTLAEDEKKRQIIVVSDRLSTVLRK